MDTALRALAALPPGSAVLTVIGDGPERENLAHLAHSLGVADAVEWRGTLDRSATAEATRHFDVMVVLSKPTPRWREQFGRVVIEAAASAVPVIVTRSGELPFLVASLGAGWTVAEDDHAAVAAILGDLSGDHQALDRAGQQARRAAAAHYADQTIIDQLADTFTRAVTAHRPG